MTIKEAIAHAEEAAKDYWNMVGDYWLDANKLRKCADEHQQLAEWLKILKAAKFEYGEAWRIITHPTPDVTYADKNRAQVILDTFRDSLGKLYRKDGE